MASPSPKAFALAKHFLQKPPKTPEDDSTAKSIAWQIEHRLQLVSFWDIKPGSRVLELGCGQGDCTVALADAVGEDGHIDAVDPGAPDYGSPYTLSEAQSYITHSTPFGPRITFHLATDPLTFLSSLPATHPPYDYAILSHCIWYFASPKTLSAITHALASKTRHLCIAEWSLRARLPAAHPHLLTALLLASLEAKRQTPRNGNIRTILSPRQIVARVTEAGAGFELVAQKTEETNAGMLDGYWETDFAMRTRGKVVRGLEEVDGTPEKEVAAMVAGFDAVESSVEGLEGGVRGVRCMDFWAGSFVAV